MQAELILRKPSGEKVVKTFDSEAEADSFITRVQNPPRMGRPPIKLRVWFEDGADLLFESIAHFADYAGVAPAQVSQRLAHAKLDLCSKIPCPAVRMTKYRIAKEDVYQEFLAAMKKS